MIERHDRVWTGHLVRGDALNGFDTYILGERLGEGAHGTVWLADHGPSRQAVAVKILRGAREAFEREVTAVARLDHRHILPVLDIGRLETPFGGHPADSPWMVTPWAGEGTLEGRARTLQEVVRIAGQLLDALAHAHARDIVHRDLKPANVLFHDGDALLADFSIASATGDRPAHAEGTPRFMAPEQFEARAVGPAADQYALGCLLYLLLAGRTPFEAGTFEEWAIAHHVEPPPPLPGGVPGPLARFVQRLLGKRVSERFPSAGMARRALAGLALGEATLPPIHDEEATLTTEGLAAWCSPRDEVRYAEPTLAIPGEWRTEPVFGRRHPAIGASLRLVRLRESRTVGRTPERDLLWQRLRTTAQRGVPDAIWIHGPPGVGTSHLARWLVVHAVELGCAVRCRLGEAAPAGSLGVVLLDAPDPATVKRVRTALAAPERGAVLHVIASDRASDAVLAEQGALDLAIGPMAPEMLQQVLIARLDLDHQAIATLQLHSGGLPARALEAVSAAIRVGAVVGGAERLRLVGALRPDAAPVLDAEERAVLQVAAAFRGRVPVDAWRAGCRSVGVRRPFPVLGRLGDLLRPHGSELVWVRPSIRSTLTSPELAGRLAAAGLGDDVQQGFWWIEAGEPRRGATCLIDAVTRVVRARAVVVQPWLDAAEQALGPFDPTDALHRRLRYQQGWRAATHGRFERVRTGGLAPASVSSLEAWMAIRRGEPERALAAIAELDVDGVVGLHLAFSRAYGHATLGHVDALEVGFEQAAERAAALGLVAWQVGCLVDEVGWLGRWDRHRRAEAPAARALALARKHGLAELEGLAELNLAEGARSLGRLDEARARFQAGERILDAVGSPAVLYARLDRLILDLDAGESVGSALAALRRLLGSFPTGRAPWLRALAAEAVAATREGRADRARALAHQLCEALEDEPAGPHADVRSLLIRLWEALAAGEERERLGAHLGAGGRPVHSNGET